LASVVVDIPARVRDEIATIPQSIRSVIDDNQTRASVAKGMRLDFEEDDAASDVEIMPDDENIEHVDKTLDPIVTAFQNRVFVRYVSTSAARGTREYLKFNHNGTKLIVETYRPREFYDPKIMVKSAGANRANFFIDVIEKHHKENKVMFNKKIKGKIIIKLPFPCEKRFFGYNYDHRDAPIVEKSSGHRWFICILKKAPGKSDEPDVIVALSDDEEQEGTEEDDSNL